MVKRLTLDEVAALSLRNLRMLDSDWNETKNKNHANTTYLDGRGIFPEYLAFHVAVGNQDILTASKLYSDKKHLSLEHVFFSTDKSELEWYLESSIEDFLNTDSTDQVYFVDLRSVTQARVQISYTSPVIFQDEINKKEYDYWFGICGEHELETAYQDWLTKYTKIFNPNRLDRLSNKKRGDYILVKDPIKVLRS